MLDRVEDERSAQLVLNALRPRLAREGEELIVQVDDCAVEHGLEFLVAVRISVVDGESVLGSATAALEPSRAVWKNWIDMPIRWEAGGLERAERSGGLSLRIEGDAAAAAELYMARPFSLEPRCWGGSFVIEAPAAPPKTKDAPPGTGRV
jgi:hypothetical protein